MGDELRDRMAKIIDSALVAWNTDMDTRDSEGEYVAQAIIDEFGLTVETGQFGVAMKRVVGKWEKK